MLKSWRPLPLLGGAIASLVLACFLFVTLAGADGGGAWIQPYNLSLQSQASLSSIPPSWSGNVDCYQDSPSSCVITTAYGYASPNAGVRLANVSDYLPIISHIDNQQHFLPVPNSNTFITYTTDPVYGFYVYFNYNFLSSIKLVNNGLGPFYQVIRPPDGKLVDKAGNKLAAGYQSISFSENGRWMIVSDPNVAMLRVNLQTFEVTPFAPGFDYSIGLDPAPQTAITNDGRYAVVASKNFGQFKIYDLSTCADVPTTISGPVNCQSLDLQSYMAQQVPGFQSAYNLRFINDEVLGLYGSSSSQNAVKYILSSGSEAVHQQDYLALGDSYMSGEGGYNYLPGTDTADNQCHVSAVSYPYLLGRYMNYNAYHSVGCSGATTKDILDASDYYTGQTVAKVPRNSRDVDSVLSDFRQGYIDQLDFIKMYEPKAVTISIGGNDIGFSAKLQDCLGSGTCYKTYEDRLEFVREVNRAFPKLVDTYTKLKNNDTPDARIYVIGYPQIAKADGDCAVNVHMNHDELTFTQQAIDYLDTVIQAASAKAGVFYVDTQDAFSGHRLCEAGAGSVAMNGLSAGNDFPDVLNGPIGRESYHPNSFGHLLLENRILAATRSLTASMPLADLTAAPPAENGLEILNAPHDGRAVNSIEYDDLMSHDVAYQQKPLDISIDGLEHSLAPNTALQAELHSTPISLGSYETGVDSSLTTQVTIPANAPTGYHTLHFYGTDITGQPVDIYKVIYVASAIDDLDGDGVLDSTQKCVGLVPSGQDLDQDGTDDACDGTIDTPPVPTEPLDISGSVSSGSNDITISTDSSSTNRPSPNSSNPQPKVLGASTTNLPAKNNLATTDNLKVPAQYYLIGSLLFLSVTSASYFVKQKLL